MSRLAGRSLELIDIFINMVLSTLSKKRLATVKKHPENPTNRASMYVSIRLSKLIQDAEKYAYGKWKV